MLPPPAPCDRRLTMLDTLTARLPSFGRANRNGSRSASASKFVRRRGHLLRNIILIALLLLAAFALLGFFAVPPIAKYYLVKTLSEQLERPVAVQEIRFNPFTLRAQVKGFSVQEKRSSQIFVSFD